MSYRKKSWQEKLADDKGHPTVFEISEKQSKRWGSGTCVIPAPLEVDALMRRVPKGKLTTIDEMRKALARKHRATIACPITTGIFSWIAAHAAAEAEAQGKKRTTSYWRILKTNGEVNPKYPGGVKELKRKLTAEGHKVLQKRNRFFVENFIGKLATLGAQPDLRHRQSHHKNTPHPRLARNLNFPAVRLNNRPGNRQPKT